MKKLYRLLLKSYTGSFIVTFCIAVFIFLMMFLFTYIDEFVGKDIHSSILAQLFFYCALNTFSKALPLSILLSCIMTMGKLTESYEIAAMKSAGISFYKITRPFFLFAICMSLLLFFFSTVILPSTNLQLRTLLISIRSSKPALLFKEGIFNNSLNGYSIRIGTIRNNGKSFQNILIYDHTEGKGNTTVMIAKTGVPVDFNSHGILFFILKDGTSYKEANDSAGILKNNKFVRSHFEQRIIRFDLSSFLFTKANELNFKDDYAIMKMNRLNLFVDSLKKLNTALITDLKNKDALWKAKNAFSEKELLNKIEINDSRILKYTIEWHKRIVASVACLLFFFIGAPLGYIIKKGGLGMPVVISTVLFILFHVISMVGEKLAEDEILRPYQGSWLPLVVMLPAGIILFYHAAADHISLEHLFNRFRKK